jgi:hypothetical protein
MIWILILRLLCSDFLYAFSCELLIVCGGSLLGGFVAAIPGRGVQRLCCSLAAHGVTNNKSGGNTSGQVNEEFVGNHKNFFL